MKTSFKYRTWCFAFLFFSAVTCRAADDKALHFGVSSVCGIFAQTALYHETELRTPSTVVLGGLIGTVPGFVKEVFDEMQDDNRFCTDDMIANIAGSFTGALIGGVLNDMVYVRLRPGREKEVIVCFKYEF